MYVGTYGAIGGGPVSFLGRGGKAFLAQIIDSLVQIPSGFTEGLFTVHETGAGLFSKLFNGCGTYVHSIKYLRPPKFLQPSILLPLLRRHRTRLRRPCLKRVIVRKASGLR